ncbi:MAG: putative Mg-chelatase [Thermodesulfobacteria bacterium]|nr:YifB family Mg chelatase-like AAA ATPase [Thermodesulfobacteriota bacterium]MCU4138955.1 putative Mg-chelatase [Thermodesulfobacteriota bacterium]
MLSKTLSFSILGIEAFPVEVEADFSLGLPGIIIVGLPDSSIKESRERIRSALKNSGFHLPNKKITVNLAPADLKKEGSGFDLAIAVTLLAGMEIIPRETLTKKAFLGELALDGRIKSTKGILPAIIKAKELKLEEVIIPYENLREASLIKNFKILGVKHLREVTDYLRGDFVPQQKKIEILMDIEFKYEEDFADVLGQELAKRAFEIAAAGGHNLLMIGPPGAGKTMLAQRIPTILPPMSYEEALETTKIYSVAGLLSSERPFILTRPFRNPHFGISEAGMIGGGTHPKPGEISLAHNGVLFLDEFPEFRKDVIEALRQPLEDGKVTITRASFTVTYPAKFMLICAMNPCRCGYYGHPTKPCQCTYQEIKKYRSKLSGPIIDRIDIHLEIPPVEFKDLIKENIKSSLDSKTIREKVINAREIQSRRYGSSLKINAKLKPKEIKKYCILEPKAEEFLEKVADKFNFSARSIHKILKVSRTIADLEESEIILKHHIAEAIQYRILEKPLWQN